MKSKLMKNRSFYSGKLIGTLLIGALLWDLPTERIFAGLIYGINDSSDSCGNGTGGGPGGGGAGGGGGGGGPLRGGYQGGAGGPSSIAAAAVSATATSCGTCSSGG